MRIKKVFFIFIFIYSMMENVSAQAGKNSFSVYYTPQITKTNFNQILENNPLFFKPFYETAVPNRSMGGNSLGIEYSRRFKKNSIGLYLQKNFRGQKSDYSYNYRGTIPTDTSDTYGGLYYTFEMESVSFGVTLERQLINKGKYYLAIQAGIGLDVYGVARLEDYLIDVQTGTLNRGCCLVEYSQTVKNGISRYVTHFNKGLYRMELSMKLVNFFAISNWLGIEISPQFFFLTKILKDSVSLDRSVPDGRIFAAGLKIGIHCQF